MSKHRREVAQQIKANKEKQLEPVHRRTTARQKAAQEEVAQASQLHHTESPNSSLVTIAHCTLKYIAYRDSSHEVSRAKCTLAVSVQLCDPDEENQILLVL